MQRLTWVESLHFYVLRQSERVCHLALWLVGDRGLYDALCFHRFGYFQETGDVGSGNIVAWHVEFF